MMNKIMALAAGVFMAGQATAEIRPEFTLGTEIYEETYLEWHQGRRFMKERASMKGITGDLRLEIDQQNAVRVTGRYAWGNSDYTGAYQGRPYGSLTLPGLSRRTWEIRSTYEWTTHAFDYPVTLSAGAGYRNLVDRLDQAGLGGYRRESKYFYGTLGVGSVFKVGDGSWTFSPKASYQHLLRGFQYSDNVVNRQDSGYGLEVSAALSRPVGTGSISVTPFYRYWKIADSKLNSSANDWMEPENKTSEFGVNLSYRF